MRWLKLADWEPKPGTRRAGIVFVYLSLAMLRVDAQTDIDAVIQERSKAPLLRRRVEDDVVGEVRYASERIRAHANIRLHLNKIASERR